MSTVIGVGLQQKRTVLSIVSTIILNAFCFYIMKKAFTLKQHEEIVLESRPGGGGPAGVCWELRDRDRREGLGRSLSL